MTYYSAAGIIDKKPTYIPTDEMQIYLAKNIIDASCKYHGITFNELCKKTRKRTIIKARKQAIFIILTTIHGIYLQDVADLFGKELEFDHSILCHHRKDVYSLLSSKEENGYKRDIENIKLIL